MQALGISLNFGDRLVSHEAAGMATVDGCEDGGWRRSDDLGKVGFWLGCFSLRRQGMSVRDRDGAMIGLQTPESPVGHC